MWSPCFFDLVEWATIDEPCLVHPDLLGLRIRLGDQMAVDMLCNQMNATFQASCPDLPGNLAESRGVGSSDLRYTKVVILSIRISRVVPL
ncbi:uncharacterized protein VTP21DRAFT_8133 [Calcarisporiella thermophila]|uniref:uncharacterized protein n=1 Tax=Calcarisporiella thermophila TaxID=911321 RepID=UPI003744A447